MAELADARDLKSRGSDPVPVRPRSPAPYRGVEQLVARRAHNPEVAGSSPVPATRNPLISAEIRGFSFIFVTFSGGLFLRSFSDPYFDPYGNPERSGPESTGEDAAHRFRRLPLCRCGHVGVGIQSEAGAVVSQHGGEGFHIHAVLQGQN